MAEKKFEETLNELEEIVKQLEKGEAPLEESLELFEKGMKLSKELRTTLDQAEKLLIKIVDENNEEQDFEPEEME